MTRIDDAVRRVRRHVIVAGRVQGVYFRASTQQFARAEQLSGWVRNLRDGRVEAVFEGPPDAVERAVDFCRVGPRGAAVARIDVQDQPVEDLDGFGVL